MKIGILTLPIGRNYGGILQAWALKCVLEDLNHDVKILRRKPQIKFYRQVELLIRRLYSKFVKGKRGVEIFRCEERVTIKNNERFINKNFKFLTTDSSYKKIVNKLDAIVVGSDQIWRPQYADGHLNDYFLEFGNDIELKRISYAASFGVDYPEFNSQEISMASSQLLRFNAVSVRENSGMELCKNMLNYSHALQMPDPTLLLNRERYEELIKGIAIPREFTKFFRYILDQNSDALKFVKLIEDHIGIKSFTVHSRIDEFNAPLVDRIHPPIEHWLIALSHSKMVVTDSFHGCVFSIIFNRNFFVIGNQNRGLARIRSLLQMFKLEHRFIDINNPQIDLEGIRSID